MGLIREIPGDYRVIEVDDQSGTLVTVGYRKIDYEFVWRSDFATIMIDFEDGLLVDKRLEYPVESFPVRILWRLTTASRFR